MTVSYHSLDIQVLATHHIVSANEVADLICPLYSLCNLAFTAFNFGNFIFPVSKSTAIFPFVKFVVYDLWLSCLLLNFGYPASRTHLACIFSEIFRENTRKSTKDFLRFSLHLSKNLTTQSAYVRYETDSHISQKCS